MLTTLSRRLSQSLSERVNDRVRMRTQEDVDYYRSHTDEIDRRVDELNSEWPLERILLMNAGIMTLAGALLGGFRHRRWFALAAVPGFFLALHGIRGWCPPVEALRRLGVRTFPEIDEERCELQDMQKE